MPHAGWVQAKEAPTHVHGWTVAFHVAQTLNLKNKASDYAVENDQYEKFMHGIYIYKNYICIDSGSSCIAARNGPLSNILFLITNSKHCCKAIQVT